MNSRRARLLRAIAGLAVIGNLAALAWCFQRIEELDYDVYEAKYVIELLEGEVERLEREIEEVSSTVSNLESDLEHRISMIEDY